MTKKEIHALSATPWQAERRWQWQKLLREKTSLNKNRLLYWEGIGCKFFEKITNEKIREWECEVVIRSFPWGYRNGDFIYRKTHDIQLCYISDSGKKFRIDIPICAPSRAHIYDF